MCTCNGVRYLDEQLDSLLRQTYPFYELIVQDDRSTDYTVEIIRFYQQKYPDRNIRLFVNPQRMGYNLNFLSAVQRATGKYIAYCDQDDIWFDNKLEVMMSEIGDAPMLACNSIKIDNNGKECGMLHPSPLPSPYPVLYLLLCPYAAGHTLLFRSDVQSRLKLMMNSTIEVYEFVTQMVATTIAPIRFIPTPLVYWRRHKHAATRDLESNNRMFVRKYGRHKGYVKAIKMCSDTTVRRCISRYFTRLEQLSFYDDTARKMVHYLAKGTWSGFIRACMLCLRHHKRVEFQSKGVTHYLRAFFRPLFFIRDISLSLNLFR